MYNTNPYKYIHHKYKSGKYNTNNKPEWVKKACYERCYTSKSYSYFRLFYC